MAILRKASVIDSLEQKWLDTQSMRMETFSSPNANKWVDFANDELAPILYPNICNTLGASWKAFDYVKKVPEFSFIQKMMIQGMGSVAMYLAASKIKSKFFSIFIFFSSVLYIEILTLLMLLYRQKKYHR